jgi:hypothetical protein
MDSYLFNPRSTFLNSLFLGGDVGNQAISPELRQIIATNQTRDAVRDLGKLQLASLYGLRESLLGQHESNQRLGELNAGLHQIGTQVASGFGDLSRGIDSVGAQIGQLTDGMQAGFDQIEVGLQLGFQAVVKGLYLIMWMNGWGRECWPVSRHWEGSYSSSTARRSGR